MTEARGGTLGSPGLRQYLGELQRTLTGQLARSQAAGQRVPTAAELASALRTARRSSVSPRTPSPPLATESKSSSSSASPPEGRRATLRPRRPPATGAAGGLGESKMSATAALSWLAANLGNEALWRPLNAALGNAQLDWRRRLAALADALDQAAGGAPPPPVLLESLEDAVLRDGAEFISRFGVYVAPSRIETAGRGLFALRGFGPEEIVEPAYTGLRYCEAQFDRLFPSALRVAKERYLHRYEHPTEGSLVIDPTDPNGNLWPVAWSENVLPYANEPPPRTVANAYFYDRFDDNPQEPIVLVTCSAIRPGDEITTRYTEEQPAYPVGRACPAVKFGKPERKTEHKGTCERAPLQRPPHKPPPVLRPRAVRDGWMWDDLEVAEDSHGALGLFARRPIARGTLIPLLGVPISDYLFQLRDPRQLVQTRQSPLDVDPAFAPLNGLGGYGLFLAGRIRFSSPLAANVALWPTGTALLYTLRDIRPGEELQGCLTYAACYSQLPAAAEPAPSPSVARETAAAAAPSFSSASSSLSLSSSSPSPLSSMPFSGRSIGAGFR